MQNFIYGAGGHGKVVFDAMQANGTYCSGFIDSDINNHWAQTVVYYPNQIPDSKLSALHIAIGNTTARAKLATNLGNLGYTFFTVQHPLSVVSKQCQIGVGTFVAATAVIAPYATVGNHVIVNHGAVVDHDCIVGHVCHIAPRAVLGGGVTVGDRVLIGSGAIVLPKISIGDDAIIGAGAVVTKNVGAGTTVVGNPARLLIK
jgi:sugar O-acyltransferase (sialic acid O-acetyltransferase NeuD family)